MRPIVIVGAGGFGREVLDIIEAVNAVEPTFDFLGFVDDGAVDEALLARRNATYLGSVDALRSLDADYVIGIGSGPVRERLARKIDAWDKAAATIVHPSATFGSDWHLGDGTVVTAGVRVTTNIVIGRHVHLNLNVTVGHDVVIADYVTINPGVTVSGNVVLDARVNLGTNSTVIQGVRVGADTIVGAGAAVVRDLPPGVTAVGVPAKPLQR